MPRPATPGAARGAAPYSSPLPTLEAERVALRAFRATDAPEVERLLADGAIARNTLTIPHPYPAGTAVPWIATHAEEWREGRAGTWAITRRADGALVGAVGLRISAVHARAEVGYWVAVAEWGKGIATEAVRRLIAFAFDELRLHRLQAHHFVENPASGRVMARAGMRAEGTRRGAFFRDGVPHDVVEYAILRTDARP
ncbi:MAG: GNAT family N-acetyltransferase [Gemmatimonadales bacterium]|nr:GNAT family N-acetyltransferase [Gemmatimonadales bacterium]